MSPDQRELVSALNCRLTRSSRQEAAGLGTVVRTLRPRTTAVQAHRPHQPRHRAAGDRDPLARELPPDLAHPVDAEVGRVHAPDLGHQRRVPLGAGRPPCRIGSPLQIGSTP